MAIPNPENPLAHVGAAGDLFKMPLLTKSYTASASASIDDLGHLVCMNSGSGLNYTVNQDSAMERPLPLNTPILLLNEGAGLITLVAGSGVTITSFKGLVSAGQGAIITLLKRGANTYFAFGDLTT